MVRWSCAAILILLLTGCASVPRQPLNPITLAVESVIKVADADTMLGRISAVDPNDPSKDGSEFQTLSIAGREDLIAGVSSSYQKKDCSSLPLAGDIWDEIERRARDTSIVIVNESHEQSRHRDFIGKLAQRLRPLGYSIYAAETLANSDDDNDQINEPGDRAYFRFYDGTYLSEPIFGRLGRLLKKNGFEFVAYEDNSPWPEPDKWPEDLLPLIHEREEGQTENLMAAIFRKRPKAKVIIHVGYSHAAEKALQMRDGREATWMAARLKAKTGVDPLTITQTTCIGGSDKTQLSKVPDRFEGAFDLAVDHPAAEYVRGRPTWRVDEGDIAVDIPDSLKPKSGWHLIEARVQGEPEDAVPMDRVAIRPAEDVALMLPPGKYTVRAVSFVTPPTKP
jgi:hypothetical protein